MKKKLLIIMFVVCMAVLIFPNLPTRAAQGKNPDELVQQINATAASVKAKTGVYTFNGYCGLYVGWQMEVLGINNGYVAGDGNVQYDNYKGLSQTSNGYNVSAYAVNDFGTLKNVLTNIANSPEPYNILVGFQKTNTPAGQKYGHAFFIHGIVNGTVYYSESFNATIGGVYYPETTPITCSIDTLCAYYGGWATGIEGVIHFKSNSGSESTVDTVEVDVITENFAEIINVESGKMLSVSANSSAQEAAVIMWDQDGSLGEQWKIVLGDSGYYLVSKCAVDAGRALNVYGNTSSIGCRICLWDITNHPTQAWIMEGQKDGSFIMRSVSDPNCCLGEVDTSTGSALTLKAYSKTDRSIRWYSNNVVDKRSNYLPFPTYVPVPEPVFEPEPTPEPTKEVTPIHTPKVTKTIKFSESKITTYKGLTTKLALVNADKNKVIWSTSDKRKGTVSSKGVVKALKANCTFKVYAKYNGKKYTATIKVEKINPRVEVIPTKTYYITKEGTGPKTYPASKSVTLKSLKINDELQITGAMKNTAGNTWYITKDGYYIYSGNCSTQKVKRTGADLAYVEGWPQESRNGNTWCTAVAITVMLRRKAALEGDDYKLVTFDPVYETFVKSGLKFAIDYIVNNKTFTTVYEEGDIIHNIDHLVALCDAHPEGYVIYGQHPTNFHAVTVSHYVENENGTYTFYVYDGVNQRDPEEVKGYGGSAPIPLNKSWYCKMFGYDEAALLRNIQYVIYIK